MSQFKLIPSAAFFKLFFMSFVLWHNLLAIFFSLPSLSHHIFHRASIGIPIVLFISLGSIAWYIGGSLMVQKKITEKQLPRAAFISFVSALLLCVVPPYTLLGSTSATLILLCLWVVHFLFLSLLITRIYGRILAYIAHHHEILPSLSSYIHLMPFLAAIVVVGTIYIGENVFPSTSEIHNGFITIKDYYMLPWGTWRLPLIVSAILTLYVWRKTLPYVLHKLPILCTHIFFLPPPIKKKSLPLSSQLLYILLILGGGTLFYVCWFYIPSFLSVIGKVNMKQIHLIICYALIGVLLSSLLFLNIQRIVQQKIWVIVGVLLLSAFLYKPMLDTMLHITTPLPKEELIDKRTENIKFRHFYTRSDTGKQYLYTVRNTLRKQYYASGMTIASKKTDTLLGKIPIIHIGKIPIKVGNKMLSGEQIVMLSFLLFILGTLSNIAFLLLGSCLFQCFSKSIYVQSAFFLLSIRTKILAIISVFLLLLSTYLAYPKIGHIAGKNGIVISIYTIIGIVTVSALLMAYLISIKKAEKIS